jgi:hypothetical protein
MKNVLYFLLVLVIGMASCDDNQNGRPNNGVPFISKVEPSSGRVGNNVSIVGGNFSKNPQENHVFFNGIKAEIHVGIDEEMIVRVPAGATTGTISVLVPGHDTVHGPEFMIEEFLKPVVYWNTAERIYKTTFNDEGAPLSKQLFNAGGMSVDMRGLEVDQEDSTLYVLDNGSGTGSFIRKLDLRGNGALEIVYDHQVEPVLQNQEAGTYPQLIRIVLDLQERSLYVTDTHGRILKGKMDGSAPLEILYDDQVISGADDSEVPWGLELVLGGDYVYWIDFRLHELRRISRTTPGDPEILFDDQDGLMVPIDVVIDEQRNCLYITDNPPTENGVNMDCIWKGNLDGSASLQKIFQGDGEVYNPVAGIALDVENNYLYWVTVLRDQEQTRQIVRANMGSATPHPDVLLNDLKPSEGKTPVHFTLGFESQDGFNGGRVSSSGHGNGRSYAGRPARTGN